MNEKYGIIRETIKLEQLNISNHSSSEMCRSNHEPHKDQDLLEGNEHTLSISEGLHTAQCIYK